MEKDPFITPGQELAFMWAYLGFAVVAYGRWAVLVIGSICRFLGINALTIPRAKLDEAKRKRELERREKSERKKKMAMAMDGGERLEGRRVGKGRLKVEKEVNGVAKGVEDRKKIQ